MKRAYSIKLFLPGGEADGLRTIEKSNWTGAGLLIPRPLLGEAKSRREMVRTGVYILMGPAEEAGLPRVYVGEGDPIRPKLESHHINKDFWTVCIAFTSKDENMNKAHVQYLEARLVEMAQKAKRCVLDNGNTPALPSLSESDMADAEGFLAEMMLCLPVLGVSVFTPVALPPANGTVLFATGKGFQPEGLETHDGFLVRAGSTAAPHESAGCPAHLKELRSALLGNGVLKSAGDQLVFTQDYEFPSHSTAAGVAFGRSSNGRTEWKTKAGQTLKELQEAK